MDSANGSTSSPAAAKATEIEHDQERVIFNSTWEVPLALTDFPGNMRNREMLSRPTFLPSVHGVSFRVCEEYIRTEYGNAGMHLVIGIGKALEAADGCYDVNGTEIRTSMTELYVALTPSTRHLESMLVWFVLTMRPSISGKICVSAYEDGSEGQGHGKRQLAALQELTPEVLGKPCNWFGLVQMMTMVRLPGTEFGSAMHLEAPIVKLIILAVALDWGVATAKGHFRGFLGLYTALVPARMVDDQTILWQLAYRRPHCLWDIQAGDLKTLFGTWKTTENMQDLLDKKALLFSAEAVQEAAQMTKAQIAQEKVQRWITHAVPERWRMPWQAKRLCKGRPVLDWKSL